MPLVRRDDAQDPVAPYVLLLWKKKWFIVGVAILTAVLTYLALLFVSSTYRVNAEVFVNQLPSVPDGDRPHPETVASMLVTQSVLEKVRNDMVQKYDVNPAPEIERFAKAFTVESTILQDTTVRKELSPVLSLSVEGKGAEATRYIMERWIHHFIADFGNYMLLEAVLKRDVYVEEMVRVEQRMAELTRERVAVETRLPFVRKMYAEKLDQLSPARLRSNSRGDEDQSQSIEVNFRQPRMMPGLLERYSEMQLRERAGDASATATAEMLALQQSINDTQTSITQIQNEYAALIFEDDRLSREIGLLDQTRGAINDAITRFTVASAAYRENAEGPLPAGGDIRALSMPVTPEARIWPKRTIAAGIAGIVGAILAIFFVLLRTYLAGISRTDQPA